MQEIDLERRQEEDARMRILATLDRTDDLDRRTREVLGRIRRDVQKDDDG